MNHGEPESLAAKAKALPPERQTRSIVETASGLWTLATSTTSLAIVDQAVVSGTRFLTTIFIGRICGSDELGVYSLTFAIYLIFSCTQEALITTPYTVFGNRLQGLRRHTLAGSVLIHSLTLSLAATLALIGGALILRTNDGELVPAFFALAVVLPSLLLWEFGRRYAIAHLQMGKALLLDVATAMLQIAGIAWLAWRSDLSAAVGYLALGAGCACTGVVWFLVHREELRFRQTSVFSNWWQNWAFGKWVLGSQIIGTLHSYTPAWVLMLAIGTAATGVFSACQHIVLLSNPFILAIANLVGATTARAYAEGGYAAVRRIVRYAAIYSVAAMTLLWIVLMLVGGQIVALLYGEEFQGNGHVVGAIAAAAPIWALSVVIAVGLRAVGRPDSNFRARMAGFLVTVVLSIALVLGWGVPGVAYALVAGHAVATLWQARAFYQTVPAEDASRLAT